MVWLRALRRLRETMAKNAKKRGRSAKNGNAPAPYTKYQKTPYIYSQAYREWHRDRKAGRVGAAVPYKKGGWKATDRDEIREFRQAAE